MKFKIEVWADKDQFPKDFETDDLQEFLMYWYDALQSRMSVKPAPKESEYDWIVTLENDYD